MFQTINVQRKTLFSSIQVCTHLFCAGCIPVYLKPPIYSCTRYLVTIHSNNTLPVIILAEWNFNFKKNPTKNPTNQTQTMGFKKIFNLHSTSLAGWHCYLLLNEGILPIHGGFCSIESGKRCCVTFSFTTISLETVLPIVNWNFFIFYVTIRVVKFIFK